MTTYALIDSNSGYLWNVVDAESPIEAAKKTDENVGCYGRRYVEERIQGTSQTGYYVRDVTGMMSTAEAWDGTDQPTIELACTGRPVAEIACYDADGD